MNFERNGSCDQKCYCSYSNLKSLYNFISTLAFEGQHAKCPVHGDLFLGQIAPDTVFLGKYG